MKESMYKRPEVVYWDVKTIVGIQAKMSGGIGTIPKGTEANPYTLNLDENKNINTRNFWFACTVDGATDFNILTSSLSSVTIYKKTLLGKQVISTNNNVMGNIEITISDCAVNNGKNTYYIDIRQSEIGNMICRVSQHLDFSTDVNDYGNKWLAETNSAVPGSIIGNNIFFWKWFMPANFVSKLYEYVSDSKFLDYQTDVVIGTLSVSMAAIGFCAGAEIAEISLIAESEIISIKNTLGYKMIASVIGFITGLKVDELFDFKTATINQLRTAANYNEERNEYETGASMAYYMNQGFGFYEFETWNERTMFGIPGYTGQWVESSDNVE